MLYKGQYLTYESPKTKTTVRVAKVAKVYFYAEKVGGGLYRKFRIDTMVEVGKKVPGRCVPYVVGG